MKIAEFDLKWVHMARYGLILRQDGAMWLRIISKPLLTPETFLERPKILKNMKIHDFLEAFRIVEKVWLYRFG